MKPGMLTTCQRRGFKLVDVNIWQVTKGTPAQHDYYWNSRLQSKCEPPSYEIAVDNPEMRILPPGATVDGVVPIKKTPTVAPQTEQMQQTIRELRQQLNSFVTRYRLTVRWKNGIVEDEWGFETEKAARSRYDRWVETFGENFEPAEIVSYSIDKEGDKTWNQE